MFNTLLVLFLVGILLDSPYTVNAEEDNRLYLAVYDQSRALYNAGIFWISANPELYQSDQNLEFRKMYTVPHPAYMPSSPEYLFSALAVDYHEGNVTYHEQANHWIQITPDVTSSESGFSIPSIEAGTSGRVNGLAIDWLAKNVYWVDEGYNWIKMTNYTGRGEVVIAEVGIERPSGIACHPYKGYLFWTELGDRYPPKIERSTMAGNNRITIVDGLTEPRSIAVDTILDRIYWTDNIAKEIKVESSDLNGNGRRTEVSEPTSLGVFDSIAVDETYIFVGGSASEDFMRYYRKVSPNELVFEYEFGSDIDLYDLCVAGPNIQSQPVTSPCDGNTCENYCVSAANNNHECLCRDDYVLNPNGTCSIDASIYYHPPFCVIGQTDAISIFDPTILHHDWLSYYGVDAYIHNFFSGSPPYVTTALVVDIHSNLLFLADDLRKEIFVVKVKGREFRVSIHKYNTGQIEGMAVDWLTLNLYFVDYVNDSRCSLAYDGKGLTCKYDVIKPTAIAVEPFARYMFWTEETSPAKLVRSDLDFANQRDLTDIGLQKPTGMTIDLKLNRIYMVGSDSKVIYSTDDDGNNKQTIGRSKYAAIDITNYQDFLILAEPLGIFSGMVEAIHKPTGEHEGSIMLDSSITAIAIADESTQPRTSPSIQDEESDSGGLNFSVVGGAIIAIIIMLAIIFAVIYNIRSKRTNTKSEMSEQNNLYDNKAFVVDMTTTKPTKRPQSSGNTPKSKGQSTPSGDTSSAELPQSSGNTPKSKGQSTPSGDTSSAELPQSSGNTPKSKGQSTPSGDTSSAELPQSSGNTPKSKGQSTPSGDTSSAELPQSSGNTPKSKGQSTPSGDTSSAERPRSLIDKPFYRWKPPSNVLEPPVFNKGK